LQRALSAGGSLPLSGIVAGDDARELSAHLASYLDGKRREVA